VEQFDPYAATQNYIDTLSPEQKEKSDAYFEGGYWILFWEFVIELVTAWIFLSLGLSKWIKGIASKTRNINVRNLIYILLYFSLAFLIAFPYSIYTDYIREHHYNLSNLTFTQWPSESLIQTALYLVFAGFLGMILYVAIRKVALHWWSLKLIFLDSMRPENLRALLQ